jgi:hypothetical protein
MEAEEAEKQLRDYLLNGIVTEIVYTLMEEPGNTVYQLARKIRLTAKTGAIASFVREARGTEPGGWRMNERDILVGVDADHDSQAVVVDLKPHARDIVSLYRMRGIVGYSYTDWTPICFLFERLFDDQAESDPKHFKQRFTREEGFRGTHAVSFVYLHRGTLEGRAWNWGHIGRVNGAILFSNAWRHFDQEIRSLGWLD